MLIEQVRDLEPASVLLYWIREREMIRDRKMFGQAKPWTNDVILQSYRFCNVRRMDDKVSHWLYNSWFEPYRNHVNMLPAVALARFLNKIETLSKITHIVFRTLWHPNILKTTLRRLRDEGETIWGSAYMVRGNDGIDKIECVVDHYVQPLIDNQVRVDTMSMEQTHANIMKSYGMGSFMAGQITADLRWALSGEWRDKHTWAPLGPGSKRGMNRLLGRDLKAPMSQNVFEGLLREHLRDGIGEQLPPQLGGRLGKLEMMDYQNCLCEFDKYCRVLYGEGRPKQNYPGA